MLLPLLLSIIIIVFCHTHPCLRHGALMEEDERLSHVLIEVIRMHMNRTPKSSPQSLLPFKYL